MRLKKKTKKNIARITVVLIIIGMIAPLLTNFFYKPTAQDLLYEQILLNQKKLEDDTTDETHIEGSYLVTEVLAGDTYKIKWGDEERTLKLIGVKAVDDTIKEVRKMVEARLLTLEFDIETEDEEGNLLAYAYLEDGEFLNRNLILQGLAKVKSETENNLYQEDFKEAQTLAKNSGQGIWEQNVQ